MVLFHDIVQVFILTDRDRGVVLSIVADDGGGIRTTLVDVNLLRRTIAADRLSQKPLGRLLIALLGEQEINGLPRLIHCAIEIDPQALVG